MKYAPVICFDKREPFYPVRVGVSVLQETGPSPSFRRELRFQLPGLERIIEYAIYWDYDMQHLYELEHVWVYVGVNGEVLDAEASFHGKYVKGLLPNRTNVVEGTHVRLYSQPGKHAFSPLPELFELLPHLRSAVQEEAGADGLSVPDMFRGIYATDEHTDRRVRRYLQSCAFEPSMKFEEYRLGEELFMEWPQLFEEIPQRIRMELDRLIALEEATSNEGDPGDGSGI
ncbi:hypothetical protein CF651_30400 [Paenibacillus rigui]|uniref:Uncharacterized protein n=2 Tax=Paenibacillus rigui TaxID=554312 RepID=A0A229UGM3_9BACL|nr:hypothetical protein CF651_30400 [Paenibacillus rigui]